MAIATIPQRAMSEQGFSFRNLIINGDMSIAQRGTSVSSVTTTGYRTCDRFQPLMNSAGTWTVSQSTDTPTGQGFANSFKFDCTSAEASPNYLIFRQMIEGQMLQQLKKGTSNAESLTLSFWVKSNLTGTYQVNLRDDDNTRIIGNTYSISSANTWEKKTITFAGDTTGTLDNDNNSSLQVEWWLASGSTYNTGSVPTSWEATNNADRAAGLTVNLADNTANDWYITGVQLEVGTTSSDFEFLPYDVNLRRCSRYYTQINQNGANGWRTFSGRVNGAADVENIGITLPTFLRTGNPTVTKSGSCIAQAWDDTGYHATSAGGGTFSVQTDSGSNTPYLNCKCNGFSGLTGGAANISFVLGTPSIEIDAEL